MKKIITVLITSIALFTTGVITGLFISKDKTIPVKTIKTVQVSGEEIRNTDFVLSGNEIKFKTTASGVGVAETTIPKTLIPEVNNWQNKNNSVQLGYYSDYKFSAAYLRRFGSLSVGAGVILPIEISDFKKCSIFLIGQLWF
ncbi:MAG: hypothetical protein JW982_07490 [Spirochaetes bacterium]|nr:hypothetical protein [Spirochaetota bacterium]